MEFNKVIATRRSIRKYKPDAIPEQWIGELIEAAQMAPSGLNLQPWRFVVVRDTAVRKQLSEACTSSFVADAPVVMVCCADLSAFSSLGARVQELLVTGSITPSSLHWLQKMEAAGNPAADLQWIRANLYQNTAIAATHLLLKATDLGLGSCWVGKFDEDKVKEAIGLDERYGVVALVTIGFADQAPEPRPRLSRNDLLLNTL